jgi:hypothetical protein
MKAYKENCLKYDKQLLNPDFALLIERFFVMNKVKFIKFNYNLTQYQMQSCFDGYMQVSSDGREVSMTIKKVRSNLEEIKNED